MKKMDFKKSSLIENYVKSYILENSPLLFFRSFRFTEKIKWKLEFFYTPSHTAHLTAQPVFPVTNIMHYCGAFVIMN